MRCNERDVAGFDSLAHYVMMLPFYSLNVARGFRLTETPQFKKDFPEYEDHNRRSLMGKGVFALIVALLAFAVSLLLRSPHNRDVVVAASNIDGGAASDDSAHLQLSTEAVSELQSVLDRVVRRPHFRYYSAALEESCPYWAVNLLCTSPEGSCTVCVCDDDQVPRAIRMELIKPVTSVAGVQCDDANSRDRVVDSVRRGYADATSGSGGHDNRVLVDLLRNPEANTGYVGEMASRIWQAIYDENCFAEGDSLNDGDGDTEAAVLHKPPYCRESALVYQLFSGLHASISTHIAANFYSNCTAEFADGSDADVFVHHRGDDRFTGNEHELHRRVLQHPSRVQNLLTLHRIVLEAVKAVKPKLIDGARCDGGLVRLGSCDDQLLRQDLTSLFASTHALRDDVSVSVQGRKKLLIDDLKSQRSGILRAVQNVTSLMDCLTCEKCRLWGGLQLSGLHTAVRILTAPSQQVADLAIDHREMVALVNLFRQLTFAVSVVVGKSIRTSTE